MITSSRFYDDMLISRISVITSVRSCGESVEHISSGRERNGLLYIFNGEVTFFSEENESVVASSGELVFLPKGKKYKSMHTAKATDAVRVNFEICNKRGEDIALFPDITIVAKDDELNRISKAMTNLMLCGASKTVDAVLRKKELMYRLLGTIYLSSVSLLAKKEVNLQIAEGLRLLEQTYLENLPVTRFAEASHISVSTFRSLFQKQLGTSPVKYRNRLRIERSKELLRESNLSVSEIATICGFENIGYFCRYYRQITGESPGETRNKL